MSNFTPFIGEPLDFSVLDGIMHCTKDDWGLAIPLRTFRINMRRAQKALDDHDTRTAEVVPMRPKRQKTPRDHAAS